MYQASRNHNQAGMTTLISDKVKFKTKSVTRDKEGHYILIKVTIHQENIKIVNIHAPIMGVPSLIKQIYWV
jgi:hypothetical protein